ncbi:MAG TPA: ribonuclease H-like domain-containing protein, partial [Deltaproteobacteria bacterium]|nr:ribonuclease H-like domain-containing protein [Deltaproteobacteria bacterium]
GTGTFPFLVGLGWFEKGAFAVCQLFARDFSEERAMLAHLCEIASEKRFLVSFNGKAFDLNLLGARFVLNRLVDTLSSMPHLDLLHPGRRLLRHRVKDARLSTIETQVLGVERGRDIEGREIPLRYFEWLKRRDGSLMAEVFRHNRVDVASMASLLKHLVDLVCGGDERVRSHDCDALAAAALLESRGESGRASVLYEAALASCDPFVRRNALAALSGIHKRAGRWETAAALWREMLDADPVDVFAAEELAKYHEHLRREYAAARDIVRSILETCAGLSNAKRLELEHRLRRLELKGGLNRCNRGSHDDNKKHSS